VGAKGVTGAGYEGHYFWDTEIYIIPFLAYTHPETARRLLRFRWHMLPTARRRAKELSQRGALYPWRTINGEEASAYYAAGTAQYHINAAVAFALKRYLDASGDVEFLAGEGVEILVETARLWEDLGFYAVNGDRVFHIHGVTGPDEYTTVVNDNLYTNVMARFNMRYAARVVELLALWNEEAYDNLLRRLDLRREEVDRWTEASNAMFLPYDEELGIHPQDASFLDREVWDFASTPPENYPLLLHYHPLVIYRFQVLKQADVVLAMFLRSDQFTLEQKRRNFDYYDPITTGDSSLSACVQAVGAAQIGYDELAFEYFREALFVDLADTHGNTCDGVHIASAGGVWGTIAFGFAGLYDSGTSLRFTPRLPASWQRLRFRVQRHGARMVIELDRQGCAVTLLDGNPVPLDVNGVLVELEVGATQRIETAPVA
jgi:alpha,alpha-trehalose phosphorylase